MAVNLDTWLPVILELQINGKTFQPPQTNQMKFMTNKLVFEKSPVEFQFEMSGYYDLVIRDASSLEELVRQDIGPMTVGNIFYHTGWTLVDS